MIEKPTIKKADGTDLKRAICIGFDESFTSLREGFYDLSDEQVRAFPIEGKKNIAWIVMHSLMNLDKYGPYTLGYLTPAPEAKHNAPTVDWQRYGSRFTMTDEPRPDDAFPTVDEMLGHLGKIEQATTETLTRLTSADLLKPIKDWWKCATDSCMRTIWHTMTHVRHIWLLRGALGWTEGQSWPHQHWY